MRITKISKTPNINIDIHRPTKLLSKQYEPKSKDVQCVKIDLLDKEIKIK